MHGDRRSRAADVRRTLGQRDRAVRIDRKVDGGLQASVHPVAERDSASDILTLQRSVPVGMVPERFEHLHESDAREHRPVHLAGAFFRRVQQPELDGVDSELLCYLVHHRLRRELGVRRARRAVCRGLGLVENNVVGVHDGVRDVVRREDALGGSPDRRAGIRSRLERQMRLGRDEFAFLRRAHLDPDVGAGRRAGGLELIRAAHRHLDRMARLLGQHGHDRLSVRLELAAKAAADLLRRQLDLRQGHVEHLRRGVTNVEGALGTVPDVDAPVVAPVDGAGVRLDVALVHRRGVELALDDHVGFLEALGDIAPLVLRVIGDVALAPRLLSELGHI